MIADYKNLGTTSFLEVNLYPRTGMVPSTCSLFTLLVMEMVRGIETVIHCISESLNQ